MNPNLSPNPMMTLSLYRIGALFAALVLAFLCGLGCKSAKVVAEQDYAPAVVAKPAMVYVADFELGAQTIKPEEGPLTGSRIRGITDNLRGKPGDPAARARQIVNLMADSLVNQLTKAGFKACRVQGSMPVSTQGWLVRGLFTEVDEGNRVRRAMIGFGEGQTDIQVITVVDDLSQGTPKPLYQVATDATSGSTPGAAPTLVLGPYGAAARFVMAGKDLEKNVKQTAAQIAQRMAKRVQAQ